MATGRPTDRLIVLGPGCAPIPESLLLAHARGRVLFVTGAGTSAAAGLPNFKDLVLSVYETIDSGMHVVLKKIITKKGNLRGIDLSGLDAKQRAELAHFQRANYDVVLGMLERRQDGTRGSTTPVRERVATVLRTSGKAPAAIHHALIRLADRGGSHSIATTNFDLLLEGAATRQHLDIQSYSLSAIPRPSRSTSFSGILHIHGALDANQHRLSDFIVSDEDFGEFYMRRRVVPDFIYDAARLFNIVLIGYSANDPPMRYLLSAVAADGTRFEDFKERYTFVGGASLADTVSLEEWKSRGITPIPYDAANDHSTLLTTMERWAALSAHRNPADVDRSIRRIVSKPRAMATDQERDLFDHFFRRADKNERLRLARVASQAKANLDWLSAVLGVTGEPEWRGS